MKSFIGLLIICFLSIHVFAAEWLTDFEQAKMNSLHTKRPILILFTKSDISTSCIRMHKLVFDAKKFLTYADKRLVLMKVDFPAVSSNQSQTVRIQNQKLLQKYKVTTFPTFYLLNSEGDIFINFVTEAGTEAKYRRIIMEMLDREAADNFANYVEKFVKLYHEPDYKRTIIISDDTPFFFEHRFPKNTLPPTPQTFPRKKNNGKFNFFQSARAPQMGFRTNVQTLEQPKKETLSNNHDIQKATPPKTKAEPTIILSEDIPASQENVPIIIMPSGQNFTGTGPRIITPDTSE